MPFSMPFRCAILAPFRTVTLGPFWGSPYERARGEMIVRPAS
jgi:hypothetical protein